MDKIISFIIVCLYVLGVLGAIGYTLMGGGYLIAVAVAVVAWLAWPKVREFIDKIIF